MRYAVEIQGENVRFFCDEGESVLQAVKRAGAAKRLLGCFGGGCGKCKVKLLSGEIVAGPMSVEHIGPREREESIFLACRIYPRSELRVAIVD